MKNNLRGLDLAYVLTFIALTGCAGRYPVSPSSVPIIQTTGAPTLTATEPAEFAVTDSAATLVPQVGSAYLQFPEYFDQHAENGVWIDIPSYYSGTMTELRSLYVMNFNPVIWDLRRGDSPKAAPFRLVHRFQSDCTISPHLGSDTGPGITRETTRKLFNQILFISHEFFYNGDLIFAVFYGGGDELHTLYIVRFESNGVNCLQQAEEVISTIELIENPFYGND